MKVKRVLLKANTTGVAPTVISSAKFGARIKAKLRVRGTLGSKQVGLCYAAGRSNAIRSRRALHGEPGTWSVALSSFVPRTRLA